MLLPENQDRDTNLAFARQFQTSGLQEQCNLCGSAMNALKSIEQR